MDPTDQMTEQAHIIRGGKEPVTRLIVHKLHPSTGQCVLLHSAYSGGSSAVAGVAVEKFGGAF